MFIENLNSICEHNKNFKKNMETYEKGVNAFADMDFNEFRSTNLGFNSKMMKLANFNNIPFTISRRSEIPRRFNWVEKGAVSRVKRQGRSLELLKIYLYERISYRSMWSVLCFLRSWKCGSTAI